MSDDPWNREEQAQVTQLSNAIQAAINAHGYVLIAEGRQPMLNALAGALVTVEAGVFASIEPAQRRMLRKAMDRARPLALSAALARNPPKAPTIVVGGPQQ